MLAAYSAFPISSFNFGLTKKLKIALVGTGIRGSSFWGKRLVDEYSDILEFVGLCDINPGRLAFAKEYIGTNCSTFIDFDEMLKKTKPDLIIVTTVDATHHQFIIKGLNSGFDVLTEKPLTTDEIKAQDIINAERKSGKKLIVGFNYRWSPYSTKIKELLANNTIGKITSVDFHWYLNTYHGASYFRRWHGQKNKGGSLWVHKATHHFDLLNWWLDSDPKEVFAIGDLEFYGKNSSFRGENCRTCTHKNNCDFYFDITKDKHLMDLYVANEEYDGYIRDNCLFKAEMHAKEMEQNALEEANSESIIVHKLWNDFDKVLIPTEKGGHGGGDKRLHDKIFITPNEKDPYERAAGSRDGVMSAIIGIAARKSIESDSPIKIKDLTDIEPSANRGK